MSGAPDLVLKFGGTSLGTARRIRRAAGRVAAHVRNGRRPVVVVSAGGRTTDRILARLQRLDGNGADTSPEPCREADRALATGEDLSAALVAFALQQEGLRACSLRGAEAGVRAGGPHGEGRILAIDTARLRWLAAAGVVPVVAGFQGVRADEETVTLGRGGSDTSAVAVAAALGGVACHLVTDVDAVYDRDPRLHRDAIPFRELTHAALLGLVRGGSRVVHPAAAELALERGVPLHVYHHRAPLAGVGTVVRPAPVLAREAS